MTIKKDNNSRHSSKKKRMSFMNWSDKLSVGVQQMDIQHKRLVELVNELYDAISSAQGGDVLQDILSGLVAYSQVHFTTEENLMQKYGFPHLAAHKKKHDELTRQTVELNERLKSGQIVAVVRVGTFLKGWLRNHIMVEDAKYSKFIIQQP